MTPDTAIMHPFAKQFLTNLTSGKHNKYDLTFQAYCILQDSFEWSGLPDGLNSRRMERWLSERSVIGSFYTREIGFTILPISTQMDLNYYEEPTKMNPVVIGNVPLTPIDIPYVERNRWNASHSAERICWDNHMRVPFTPFLDSILAEISKTLRAIENLRLQLQLMYIIKGSKTQMATFEKILTNLEQGKLATLVSEHVTPNDHIELLNTQVNPEHLYALTDLFYKQLNMLWELLSMPYNPNAGKKERQISGELTVQFARTFAIANSRLRNREQFCANTNKAYNNIDIGGRQILYNGKLECIQSLSKFTALLESSMGSFVQNLEQQHTALSFLSTDMNDAHQDDIQRIVDSRNPDRTPVTGSTGE